MLPAFESYNLTTTRHRTVFLRYATLGLLSVLVPLIANASQTISLAILYIPSLVLALLTMSSDSVLSSGLLLAVVHGLTHHAWPFINEHGLDSSYTVFFDQGVHAVLGLWAHVVALRLNSNSERARMCLHIVGTFLLVGNVVSCIASCFLPADDPLFVESAMFSAINSGYFAAAALTLGLNCRGWELPKHLVLWTIFCFAFYYGFRASNDALAFMFVHRFFESFFMLPLWACIIFPASPEQQKRTTKQD